MKTTSKIAGNFLSIPLLEIDIGISFLELKRSILQLLILV